jgi:hypothetical protein
VRFQPYGPFELPRSNGGIDLRKKNAFWRSLDDEYPSLPSAVGCYIFGLKAAKGYGPWYVGKTEKQCFMTETWQPSKLLSYGDVIRSHSGKPILFLLAKITPSGRFAKPTTRKSGSIKALEEMLIGTCLQRNCKLLNKKTTRYLKRLHVPGYLNDNPGARPKMVKALARLLGT